VREGWTETTLGLACSIARGGSPRPIQSFLTQGEDGINWVKISDATVSGKYIYQTSEKIKPTGAARSRLVKEGDFLLSNSMSFGRPYIMRTTGCIHDGWLVLSQYQDTFDQDFLYHLLGSPQVFGQFDRLAAGSTVRNLNIELASKVTIPVPPISEQRRVVAILDEAFEGIATAKAHAEKNLQNAREVFDTYLATTFAGAGVGWSVGPVGAVADCCLGKMLDKAKNKGDAKPYLRNLNVRWFEFDLTDVQEMRFTPEEYERYSVRRGDVVICEGGYPGRAAVWEEDRPIFIQKALHRVRFKDAILGRWFLYYLYSQEASGALQQYFTGTGIQHFTGAALSRLPFPLAPSAVTATLVERFDALAGHGLPYLGRRGRHAPIAGDGLRARCDQGARAAPALVAGAEPAAQPGLRFQGGGTSGGAPGGAGNPGGARRTRVFPEHSLHPNR
jgi:type I restriction enzyme S subunit